MLGWYGDPQRLAAPWLMALAHLSPFTLPNGSQSLLWGHFSGYCVDLFASALRSVHVSPMKILWFDVVFDSIHKPLCHHFVLKFLLFLYAV